MADCKFAIWESWADTFDQMSDEQLASLVRGMCAYAFDGVDPSFERGTVEALVWPTMKAAVRKSVDITRRNQENGSKHTGRPNDSGGKPSGKPKAKPSTKPTGKSGLTQRKPEKNRREVEGNSGELLNNSPTIPTAGAGACVDGHAPRTSVKWACPKCGSPAYEEPGGWRCPKHGPIPLADPVADRESTECPDSVAASVMATFGVAMP